MMTILNWLAAPDRILARFILFSSIGLLTLAGGGFALFNTSFHASFRGEAFNHEIWTAVDTCWNAASEECTHIRQGCPLGRMVQDLQDTHLHRGISRTEIIALLGLPDGTIELRGQLCETHFVGFCSPFAFSGDSLYLCFDENGRLSRSGYVPND